VKGTAPASDCTYPGVIERRLLASGRNVMVRNHTAPGERVPTGIRNWEAQIFAWSPDVVVLDYARHEAERRSLGGSLTRRAARFADDLERLVERIVYISNPLVLLPAAPAGDGPGALINSALGEVVTRLERDNVRVLDVSDDDPEAIGRAMAEVIGPWCDEHVPV
jgi:hypothetical protein